MRNKHLRDLAPAFTIKNTGWGSRLFCWAVVGLLGISLLAEGAVHQKATPALSKWPGVSQVLNALGLLPREKK